MTDKANTHVAVHAIQYHDAKKNPQTVKAGSEFVAKDVLSDDDIKALTASGAIRAVKRGRAAATEDDTSKKDGGTAHATGSQATK